MARSESDLIREFKDSFMTRWQLNGYWRKLHGGMYQSGLPDVLCSTPYGTAMVEFKWLPKSSDANSNTLLLRGMAKLTDLQKAELDCIAKTTMKAFLVVGTKVNGQDFAVSQMLGQYGGTSQLRKRGEPWDLDRLLKGISE